MKEHVLIAVILSFGVIIVGSIAKVRENKTDYKPSTTIEKTSSNDDSSGIGYNLRTGRIGLDLGGGLILDSSRGISLGIPF